MIVADFSSTKLVSSFGEDGYLMIMQHSKTCQKEDDEHILQCLYYILTHLRPFGHGYVMFIISKACK